MKDYPKLITCMAPSKTFNLAGLAFSNIIIRDPGLRARFKDRDKLFGMVNPMSLTAAKAAYDKGGSWLEGGNALFVGNAAGYLLLLLKYERRMKHCAPSAVSCWFIPRRTYCNISSG